MFVMSFTIPFSYKERRPYLGEGFFYVPSYFTRHQEFSFPFLKDLFTQKNLVLELCSGNGEWIVQKAADYPHLFWIAVEKRCDRAKKIWKRGQNLDNLFVVLGEATTFISNYIPKSSIKRIFINFPDPWPKAKHAKHRLIDLRLKEELERILPSYHQVTISTDDPGYKMQIIDVFSSSWEKEFPYPNFISTWPGFGTSFFNRLWEGKNKEIFYLSFTNQRNHHAPLGS